MSSEPISTFAQLALAAPVLQAIHDVGYESPSPIQAESISPLLLGRDLVGQAQTGTGKTAAFALPLLSRLDVALKKPQVLVLTPTRELAIQVAEAMQTYARHLPGFHVAPIYGGQSMTMQLRQLRRGVHAIVGTPGRIMDHLRRKTLCLDTLMAVVLDEADEMLRMGFIDEVEQILSYAPATRQVVLFSATMPNVIRKVAQRHLREPVEIRIKTQTATLSTVTQRYWQVTELHKLDALTRILEIEDFDAAIIFVRTKVATTELAQKLEARGYSCAALNGDMNQSLREKTVEQLRTGALDIVVATDIAARGLDVERISHVVNYDIPCDTETYIHRIGRTGRAGRAGDTILFVTPREKRMLRAIEQATRQSIEPMKLPSRADIANRRIAQFKQTISDTIESEDLQFFEALIGSYQQECETSLSDIAAALAFLAQQERPLSPPSGPCRYSQNLSQSLRC
jgi:ATP-dependent RNA helicase DeaD